MNREILFRGKCDTTREWVFGYLVMVKDAELNREYPCIVVSYDNDSFDWYNVDWKTIGQYTGLKDKNGVKIFEGDLLEDNYIDDGDNEVESSVAVIWDDITACWAIDNSFLQDGSSKTNLVDYLGIENLLTVGNIHDNE